jgi:S-adenosylmethionine-diacylglycerol 3-amino-3-carboxypropyl transferase
MAIAQWVRTRSFNLVHGHHLVYNACWEDPRLDRSALAVGPDDTILAITSAGCNVLDYALDDPYHIYAVDVNPRQNALLELKIAGIRTLEYDDFFEIFGRGTRPDFEHLYRGTLRPHLSPEAQRYWDRHTNYFTGQGRHKTFYYHGSSGWVARMMNLYIDCVARIRDEVDALMAAPTLEEQQALYNDMHDIFWSRPLCWALGRDSLLSLLGVPRSQRLQIEKHYEGNIVYYIQACLATVFGHRSLADNYFWRVYLYGEYTPGCCPAYLHRENFQALRDRGVDRISVHTTSIEYFLQHVEEPISRFVLLDHMDWLSHFRQPALKREWQAIVDKAAPRTRLIWRSGGLEVDYVDPLEVQVGGAGVQVGDLLTYHQGLADQLHARDRVGTYGRFYIADLNVA